MAEGVLMPKEGITVESCIIGEWKKNVGDQVNVGDILFTYETDKAEFECESTAAGTLLEKFYEDGDEVPCLVNVCAIGNPGEDTSALKNAPAASAAPAAAAAEAPKAAAPAAVIASIATGSVRAASGRPRPFPARFISKRRGSLRSLSFFIFACRPCPGARPGQRRRPAAA